MDEQILKAQALIQQLATHLVGLVPLRTQVIEQDTFNLIPHRYMASIGDMEQLGSYETDPKAALLSALELLLVKVYTRLNDARTALVLPSLQEQARQFTLVGNLGF